MKVSIIGGGGVVGSATAFALQCAGTVSEICLIDANKDLALGQAIDLLHGSSLAADQRIYAGDLADIRTSSLVIITAGLRRKPDESRLDLINRNVDLFLSILREARSIGWRDHAVLLVVSNPVDVLTYLAVQHSGLPPSRVLGLGTVLDTARFRSYIADQFKVPATQVAGWVLGEHGDSMVPIWSSVRISGWPIEQWPGYTPQVERLIEQRTRQAGAEMIRLKGASAFAVALSIREVVQAILFDQRRLLPVSTWQDGKYGVRGICFSIPTVLGCGGVREQLELSLTPREQVALHQSAQVLAEVIRQVEDRIAKHGTSSEAHLSASAPASPISDRSPVTGTSLGKTAISSTNRTIPRSAWQIARPTST